MLTYRELLEDREWKDAESALKGAGLSSEISRMHSVSKHGKGMVIMTKPHAGNGGYLRDAPDRTSKSHHFEKTLTGYKHIKTDG